MYKWLHAGAARLGESVTVQALAELQLPPAQADADEWGAFAVALRALMQQHRDIGHEWGLSWEQEQKLDAYLQANLLLTECLQVAAVADRKGIEDRILLPPA